MHRLVLVFLLLLLPVQWTWAAAASVCRHESGAASQHFAHHEHHHEAGVNGAAADVQKLPETGTSLSDLAHADCASCHGAAPALTALLRAPALHPPPLQGATPYLRVVTAGIPERLIRPPHASFS